jgi:hypothetical protein
LKTYLFISFAKSFENVVEKPHFEAISFWIKEKIFTSLEIEKAKACLKLSKEDQATFSKMHKGIYPVNNKWGESGWTYFEIEILNEELVFEALEDAYNEVSKAKK